MSRHDYTANVEDLYATSKNKRNYKGFYQIVLKRFIDIVLCVIIIPVILLLTIPIAIAIKIEDGGPIFYKSRRLGKCFKEFNMLKFRSMKVNAPDLRNDDGSTYNSQNDNRVTRIGRFIRETSLDELPQCFNVLVGHMSILGPRAGDVESKDTYEEDEKDKLLVRPGISGYTQAYYRNNLGVRDKRLYDAWYAHNVSLWLDIKILFKTIATVLKRENVYTNDESAERENKEMVVASTNKEKKMAVSKKLKGIYFSFFEKPEIFAANIISKLEEKRILNRNIDKTFKLSKAQKKQIKDFWKPYCRVSPKWVQYYAAKNGQFDPRYIPNDLYYTKIDQHFNSRKLGYGFNDKNYYSKIFAGIKQPEVVVRKINSLIFDENYCQISAEEAKNKILQNKEVICKPSQETGSGRGIMFFDSNNIKAIESFLTDKSYDDYVVQKLIEQHNQLDKVHKGSINCLRITSILFEDGVHILSAVLRMGFGNSKVDNATAKDNAGYDGMSCGIDENGCLKKHAHGYTTGNSSEKHPDGLIFEGFKIPSFYNAVELVKNAHPLIGHFRLVSWDIAIDKDGDPVLIEANMRKGGINFHQFNNGPLFGNLTERILRDVFELEN